VNEAHVQPGQRRLDLFTLVAGDDDHRIKLGCQRSPGNSADHRLAAPPGEQLVGRAET
jgi:hypothetical protein